MLRVTARSLTWSTIDHAVIAEARLEARIVKLPRLPRDRKWVPLFVAGVVIAMMLLAMFCRDWIRQWSAIWLIVPALVGSLAAIGVIYSLVTIRHRERRFRMALVRRGVPICVECSYLLHGLGQEACCPECGAKRRPAGRGIST
jgi:hypothetical protein